MKLCANHIRSRHRSVNVEEKTDNYQSAKQTGGDYWCRHPSHGIRKPHTACTWAVRVEAKLKVRRVSTGLPEQRT